MCGMCLPHCPTYHIFHDEGESPRGRIALIQGLANGRLTLSNHLESHLDHCLGCRACEAVCPSGVSFGEIIDNGRALIHEQRKNGTNPRYLRSLVTRPKRLRRLGRILRFIQRSGLQNLARSTGITRALGLSRLDALLPPLTPLPSWRDYYPPVDKKRGEVALFLGCFAEFSDRAALNATIQVLTRIGYGVHVPPSQVCCGALHLHEGDRRIAHHLAECNAAVFNSLKVDAILNTASGCAATLMEASQNGFPCLTAPICDVSTFISMQPWPSEIGLAPLDKRVAIHDPCSLRNVLNQVTSPCQLLARIPKLEIVALPENHRCCGAAGSYMLTQVEIADRLRDEKIAALRSLDADILVTSNPGCALHLGAGIKAAGLNIPVMHAVTLVAQQMQTTGKST